MVLHLYRPAMATESWAQPDGKPPLAQGQKTAALSTALALVVAAVIPSCGAARIQPAPAGISPQWMMWSVGAVVVSYAAPHTSLSFVSCILYCCVQKRHVRARHG